MDFSSISQSYKHLVLRWMIRSNRTDEVTYTSPQWDVGIRFNFNPMETNYTTVIGEETQLSWLSTITRGFERGRVGWTTHTAYRGDILQGELWIHDYTSATTYKQCQGRSLHGSGGAGGGYVDNMQVVWWSTSAITGIRLSDWSNAFAIGSVAKLYGVTA